MVVGPRIDDRTRRMIRSLKEIVGNHSDDDIMEALKESDMDLDEAAQRLLNQDPFREVKRKRNRKKEATKEKGSASDTRESVAVSEGSKSCVYPSRNLRRGGHTRTAVHGTNREFRVVRDNRANFNRANLNTDGEPNYKKDVNETEKGSMRNANSQQPSGPQSSRKNGRHSFVAPSGGIRNKDSFVAKQAAAPNVSPKLRTTKPYNSHSANLQSDASLGLHPSSSDPVHLPSHDSRSSGARAIRREVGAMGVSRVSKENTINGSSAVSTPFLRKQSPLGSYPSSNHGTKFGQPDQATISDGIASGRTFSVGQHFNRNIHFGSKLQGGSYQKAPSHNKEWKPKVSQKSNAVNPGIIGTPKKATLTANKSADAEPKASELQEMQERLLQVNISDNQNVIIPQHIRVPETDRCGLTFGSFGPESESSQDAVSRFRVDDITKGASVESLTSLSMPASVASGDGTAGSKPMNGIVDDKVRHSGPDSSVNKASDGQQLPERGGSSRPQNLGDYADIGIIRSGTRLETQQLQNPSELQSFSAYDPENGYDVLYFRPTMDETVRGQGIVTPQETANSMPASTISMLQQQPPQIAPVYPPQVHVSHFSNLMPYRQFLSPVYLPQMAMPGYSGNPAYPHPSNGSNYLLMPGGSSHLSANGVKYGIQQFKPVPTGNATGFGSFANPSGYPVNSPSAVGHATGLDDSSRVKFKDGNIYVPNPMSENAEMWIQNPRELQGLQSPPFYNMPGQSPHAAYMPSHTGHASFNPAAVPQSSHMPFPGVFHPPQPAAIANHMGPAMGGNVGVGIAPPTPGAQAYQQSQLGHLNWASNF